MLDRIAEAEVRLTQAERIAAEADATAVEAVALTRAFVELAWAEQGIAAGTFNRARESLAVARQRIERVANAHGGAPALIDQSDDIRSTLRILRPILQRTEARLHDADGEGTGY